MLMNTSRCMNTARADTNTEKLKSKTQWTAVLIPQLPLLRLTHTRDVNSSSDSKRVGVQL